MTFDEAMDIWAKRSGCIESRPDGKVWLSGEFKITELEALCIINGRPEDTFKFVIGANVSLSMSGEKGEIIGRAEYKTESNKYYVRYVTAQGSQTEDWISENALVSA